MQYNKMYGNLARRGETVIILIALVATILSISTGVSAMAFRANYYYLQSYAHNMVKLALRQGDLIKPNCCSKCGNYDSLIEAHHYDYSLPLSVIWLCRSCHLKIHGSRLRMHTKVQNASELARAYFNAHPEALDMPARELVDVIGVGKSTINNVQQSMRKGGDE